MLERAEKLIPFLILLYPSLILISISLAEIVLFSSILIFLWLVAKGRVKFEYPTFFIPLIFYSIFSIISAFFSYLPLKSLYSLKELFLILSIPLIYSLLKISDKKIKTFISFLFYSVLISSLFSIGQFIYFIAKKSQSPRSYGFESHYMTQAGIMMILSLFALSYILNQKGKSDLKLLIIFTLTILTLLLTLTRSAWIGFLIASFFLIVRKKAVLVILFLFLIIFFYFTSPAPIKSRIKSFANMKDLTFQNRIIMIKKGIRMIKDKPFWGVGPGMIRYAYTVPRYKVKEKEELHSHLHNNFIQIWAERGLFAFLSWLGFIIIAFYSLFKIKSEDEFKKIAKESAIFILLAFLIAGLFEFNFGDSEILMLLFWFLSIPFIKKEEEYS